MTVAVRPRTEGGNVAAFIEGYCRPSKGDDLLALRPWQRELIDDLFALDDQGRRRHRQALIGMPRKNGKSTIGAALALYGLLVDNQPGAEVYSVAGDRMQAGIVFREARAMVDADIDLLDRCRVYRNHIEVPDTGGVYRVLSADAPRAQGLNPSFVIFDEVHVQPNDDLWSAMTLGTGTRREPMVIGITTAGFDRASLCGRLYEHGKRVQSGEVVDDAFFFRWWEPADPNADWRDPKVWAESNPAFGDFLLPERFVDDIANTPENQFRRYRLNQWTTTAEAWLPHGAWNALARPDRVVDPDEPVMLGFDGAWTGDSVALMGCTVKDEHVFTVGAWEPGDGPVDGEAIDQAVREAHANFRVVRMGADPFLWRREIDAWRRDGLPVLDWPTNAVARMAPACSEFYRAVVEQRMTHDGDPGTARHIANAIVRDDRHGRRITKESTKRKIDRAVAAIIAHDLARKPPQHRRAPTVHSF
jgi:phage terminase large subunit-like protein